MKVIENQREYMRSYLLGVLTEAEQTALEDHFLNDDEVFEQLVAVENELVDTYARGQLNAPERRQFERHYLAHPSRRERLRFAQALTKKIDRRPDAQTASSTAIPSTSWWSKLTDFFRLPQSGLSWAMSVALVLMAVTVGAIYWQIHRQISKLDVAVTDTPQPTVSPSPSVNLPPSPMLSPAVPEKSQPTFASLALSIGSLRGESNESTPRLTLTAEMEFARLQLAFRRQDYPQYNVSLSLAGGAEIWRKQGIKANAGAAKETLTINVPANKLPAGEYLLTVRGVSQSGELEDIGKSSFRVTRK
ncbi:MAG TPA: hypothetical protein PLD20_09565 [Blastocatellia bacterium]|nr:hypothetical protein [Blastocatellia bacterium]HMV86144.1 hypothetical protein [Blastocatellia bacterium]HMX25340.1 hypothetical protein [Blastocatellia bacterium]HMY71026.1 hypothetical protein [Blastocatellia bacterium]HMZ18166.1 hypothetical protein [Blastocatellia bacterium]